MTPPVPAWKFWHPLPFWQVLVVFAVAQLVLTFLVVALREGLHLPVPQWVAGGVGGAIGVVVVQALARRHRPG